MENNDNYPINMPITPSYLELCVKLYVGQEN